VLLRIILVTAAIAAGMAFIKDGRALERSGLVHTCTAVTAPAGQAGVWQACKPGKLEGRPDLTRKSCVSQGTAGEIEVWRCPTPIGTGPLPIAVATG
jgi:hypothetical protein